MPLVRPERTDLEVQVIGQQWAFTYRYPSYGGMESPHLVLPEGQTIEMHVTSLDVIHSFWAVELGAKADAVPGFDNVLYLEPLEDGGFEIKCAELCGLWHGQMYDTGEVLSARSSTRGPPSSSRTRRTSRSSCRTTPTRTCPMPQYRGG